MPYPLRVVAIWISRHTLVALGSAVAVLIAGYGVFYWFDVYGTFSSGDDDSTIALLQQAVVRNPGETSIRIQLASAYLDIGQLDRAAAEFQEIVRAKPEETEAMTGLGMVYFKQGQNAQALVYFDTIIRTLESQKYAQFSSDLNNAYYYSGVILLQEARYQEAEAALRKAVATNGADGDARMYLGQALCRLNRCDEGLIEATTATRFLPDKAEPRYYRGLILERLGRIDEARGEFSLALKYRPDYEVAAAALRRLKQAQQ